GSRKAGGADRKTAQGRRQAAAGNEFGADRRSGLPADPPGPIERWREAGLLGGEGKRPGREIAERRDAEERRRGEPRQRPEEGPERRQRPEHPERQGKRTPDGRLHRQRPEKAQRERPP